MGLFSKSDHESKDPEIRLEALSKTEDQNVLANLAKSDSSPRVRLAAVAKVSDQDLLAEIALDGNEIDSRIAAVGKIESQQKLADIIKVRRNFKLMGACFARITDKKILNAIANDTGYNMSARRMAIEGFADESYLSEATIEAEGTAKPKSPEEINALIKKHGGVRLARALGRFRGSTAALMALGEIMRRGGEAAVIALEYLAQALAHANSAVAQTAHDQLVTLNDGELVAKLIAQMENPNLQDAILNVLKKIDHPDARQVAEDSE